MTFSTGVATCRDDRTNSETLAAADLARYAAKREGRNTDRLERAPHTSAR